MAEALLAACPDTSKQRQSDYVLETRVEDSEAESSITGSPYILRGLRNLNRPTERPVVQIDLIPLQHESPSLCWEQDNLSPEIPRINKPSPLESQTRNCQYDPDACEEMLNNARNPGKTVTCDVSNGVSSDEETCSEVSEVLCNFSSVTRTETEDNDNKQKSQVVKRTTADSQRIEPDRRVIAGSQSIDSQITQYGRQAECQGPDSQSTQSGRHAECHNPDSQSTQSGRHAECQGPDSQSTQSGRHAGCQGPDSQSLKYSGHLDVESRGPNSQSTKSSNSQISRRNIKKILERHENEMAAANKAEKVMSKALRHYNTENSGAAAQEMFNALCTVRPLLAKLNKLQQQERLLCMERYSKVKVKRTQKETVKQQARLLQERQKRLYGLFKQQKKMIDITNNWESTQEDSERKTLQSCTAVGRNLKRSTTFEQNRNFVEKRLKPSSPKATIQNAASPKPTAFGTDGLHPPIYGNRKGITDRKHNDFKLSANCDVNFDKTIGETENFRRKVDSCGISASGERWRDDVRATSVHGDAGKANTKPSREVHSNSAITTRTLNKSGSNLEETEKKAGLYVHGQPVLKPVLSRESMSPRQPLCEVTASEPAMSPQILPDGRRKMPAKVQFLSPSSSIDVPAVKVTARKPTPMATSVTEASVVEQKYHDLHKNQRFSKVNRGQSHSAAQDPFLLALPSSEQPAVEINEARPRTLDSGARAAELYPALRGLIDSGVIKPGENVLSLRTQTGTALGTLTAEGFIQCSGGETFRSPMAWCSAFVRSSTSNKHVPYKRHTAYHKVRYRGTPLSEMCPDVSKKISVLQSGSSQNTKSMLKDYIQRENSSDFANGIEKTSRCGHFDWLDDFLSKCTVLLIDDRELAVASRDSDAYLESAQFIDTIDKW